MERDVDAERTDVASMIIVVDDSRRLTLTDESNFKELSLHVPSVTSSSQAIEEGLFPVEFDVKDGYAWIPAVWLLSQRSLSAWQADVRAMLDAVERFGWYDRTSDRVRVHITTGSEH